jgi:hypothetical protein
VIGLCATPPARAAIAEVLRFGSERISREEAPPARRVLPPATPGAPLPDLGTRTTLAEARRRLVVVAPTAPGYAVPDEVWFAPVPGGRVSLVYDPRGGRAQLLLQQFGGDGRTSVRKYLDDGTDAEAVRIGGEQGVFLSGDAHAVWYTAADGQDVDEVGRLAGNALIFQRGALTIRLEGDLPRDRMVAIAESLR